MYVCLFKCAWVYENAAKSGMTFIIMHPNIITFLVVTQLLRNLEWFKIKTNS